MSVEYKLVESYLYMSIEELNALGAEGWRMCGMIDSQLPLRFYFMRDHWTDESEPLKIPALEDLRAGRMTPAVKLHE